MTIEPERRRRAIYRARYRGTKELDWMLGKFADARVSDMATAELTAFEELLAMPEPDLQKWLMNGVGYEGSTLAGLIDDIRAFHGLGAGAQ
jgi:antitoxin CptB